MAFYFYKCRSLHKARNFNSPLLKLSAFSFPVKFRTVCYFHGMYRLRFRKHGMHNPIWFLPVRLSTRGQMLGIGLVWDVRIA